MANQYKLTGKEYSASGQAALVFEAFEQLGTTDGHAIADWLDACPRFKTRQSSTRISFYYITVMAKLGVIEMVNEDGKYPAMERVGGEHGLLVEVKPDTKAAQPLIILTDVR